MQHLQWGNEEITKYVTENKIEKLDVIIGADIMFWPDSILPLAETLSFLMGRFKCKVFISGEIRANWSENTFVDSLQKHSLRRELLMVNDNVNIYEII